MSGEQHLIHATFVLDQPARAVWRREAAVKRVTRLVGDRHGSICELNEFSASIVLKGAFEDATNVALLLEACELAASLGARGEGWLSTFIERRDPEGVRLVLEAGTTRENSLDSAGLLAVEHQAAELLERLADPGGVLLHQLDAEWELVRAIVRHAFERLVRASFDEVAMAYREAERENLVGTPVDVRTGEDLIRLMQANLPRVGAVDEPLSYLPLRLLPRVDPPAGEALALRCLEIPASDEFYAAALDALAAATSPEAVEHAASVLENDALADTVTASAAARVLVLARSRKHP